MTIALKRPLPQGIRRSIWMRRWISNGSVQSLRRLRDGRPTLDAVLKFKTLAMQNLYGMSLDATETTTRDRLTWLHFYGLLGRTRRPMRRRRTRKRAGRSITKRRRGVVHIFGSSGCNAASPPIEEVGPTPVFEAAFDGEQGLGARLRPAASRWRNSASCALPAMMPGARRSRVFGNRPGTDPS